MVSGPRELRATAFWKGFVFVFYRQDQLSFMPTFFVSCWTGIRFFFWLWYMEQFWWMEEKGREKEKRMRAVWGTFWMGVLVMGVLFKLFCARGRLLMGWLTRFLMRVWWLLFLMRGVLLLLFGLLRLGVGMIMMSMMGRTEVFLDSLHPSPFFFSSFGRCPWEFLSYFLGDVLY